MEEAVAALSVNEVSTPVVTDAGTHLILVTERRDGAAPELEEMRPQIEEQLQLAAATVDLLLTVEQLKDLAFNAEDLSRPAAELELTVKRSEPIARDQVDGLFANPALLAAAFSDEVMEERHNSDVIELGEDRFVVMSVSKHTPPQVRELDEVRDEIAAIIVEQSARAKVAAESDRVVEELASGATIEQVANSAGYEWQVELGADRRTSNVPREVLGRAFEMAAPAEGETLVDVVMTPSGDAQVIALGSVNPGSLQALDPPAQIALQRQLSSEYSNLVDGEFQRGLRESADISVM